MTHHLAISRMDALPPELLLYFVPFLPLTSLIAARGVCTRWRTLAQRAPLHPARKTLLDLYLAAIVHPNFPSLAEALRPHVHAFDRTAYVAGLVARGCVLPDLFELWVLEWPSKAVHFWAWPGLEKRFAIDHEFYYDCGSLLGDVASPGGGSGSEGDEEELMDALAPRIDTIPVPKTKVSALGSPTCLALALWQAYLWSSLGVIRLWLVVDPDPNEHVNDRRAGTLLWTFSEFVDGPLGRFHHGPKVLFYDAPFGAAARGGLGLVDFLGLLDVSEDRVDGKMEGYYLAGGVRQIDGE